VGVGELRSSPSDMGSEVEDRRRRGHVGEDEGSPPPSVHCATMVKRWMREGCDLLYLCNGREEIRNCFKKCKYWGWDKRSVGEPSSLILIVFKYWDAIR
jgi:hypothetical protein